MAEPEAAKQFLRNGYESWEPTAWCDPPLGYRELA